MRSNSRARSNRSTPHWPSRSARRLVARGIGAFVFVVGCGTGTHSAEKPVLGRSALPRPTASDASAQLDTAISAPLPDGLPSAAPSAETRGPPERFGPAGAGSIGCGSAVCAVATEVCCAEPRDALYACAPRVETPSPRVFEGPGGPIDLAKPSCKTASGAGMFEPLLWFCDSSDDCATGEVCCQQDVGWTMCVRAKGEAASTCHSGESCAAGSCRSKGARCDLDVATCRSTDRHVACGGAVCTDDAPVCCMIGGQSTCVRASASCETLDSARIECRSAADCLSGQKCCVSNGNSTHCGGTCFNDDMPTCATAADCRGVAAHTFEFGSQVASACAVIPSTGIRSCMTADEASRLR
jgi:hypothetical protein